MFSRLALLIAGMGISASVARAQTAPLPPQLPAPPLTFPIVPAPLAEQVPDVLSADADKVRTFQVTLKYVKPSVMAYWLDPKNHARPDGFPDVTAPRGNFALPVGVERIVAVDAQNALLVFGTALGVVKMQQVITLLDRPQRTTPVADAAGVSFDASLYWIDSLAPVAQQWQQAARIPRIARRDEVEALVALTGQDRASLQLLLPRIPANGVGTSLVLPALESSERKPTARNFSNGQEFRSPMPRINPDLNIDPGIQSYHPNPAISASADQNGLLLLPIGVEQDALQLYVVTLGNLHVPLTNLALHDGDTFLLSGSATEKELKAPSPRFDSFVLAVKIHIPQLPTLVPAPEPAK